MSQLKTVPNDASVDAFLAGVDGRRQQDCLTLMDLMREATGEEPRMWGEAIVGFGSYRYRYASGREGDWFLAGFSPRKQNLTLYLMGGFQGYPELLAALGRHSTGQSCLYVKSLADVDMDRLRSLVQASVAHMRAAYPTTA
ncbi:MAG: DUF1801 domain-containing protein [Anaerolineae bacterium]